jgi:hypothetical protein
VREGEGAEAGEGERAAHGGHGSSEADGVAHVVDHSLREGCPVRLGCGEDRVAEIPKAELAADCRAVGAKNPSGKPLPIGRSTIRV